MEAGLQIHGLSPDGTLVFGAGVRDGKIEGFVAKFGLGVLADLQSAARAACEHLPGRRLGFCDPDECDFSGPPEGVLVFTADGAYFLVGDDGFERGFYTYSGSVLTFTTLFDTDGDGGSFWFQRMAHRPDRRRRGHDCAPGGPLGGIRFSSSAAEPLVGAWIQGNPTLPGNSFVAVFLGSDRGHAFFQGSDIPEFGVGAEAGTYTWDPVTYQLDIMPLSGPPDVGNFATPAPEGLSLFVVGDDGEAFTLNRVIDPTTIPVISSPLSASGIVGEAFSYRVVATNAVTFGATGLPDGLSIDSSTGAISGMPNVGGQFAVTISATNASGVSDIDTLTLTIAIPTPVGQNVVVEPEVPEGQGPVTLTFGEITSEGTTTVTVLDLDESEIPPPGSVGVAGVVYEVETTATYQGLITLCFSYAGIDFGDADAAVVPL